MAPAFNEVTLKTKSVSCPEDFVIAKVTTKIERFFFVCGLGGNRTETGFFSSFFFLFESTLLGFTSTPQVVQRKRGHIFIHVIIFSFLANTFCLTKNSSLTCT